MFIAKSGIHFTDPREFFRAIVGDVNLCVMPIGGTGVNSQAAGFFTEVGLRGVADNTNWTAATYKTILSVTGKGYVFNCFGPTGLAGTPTTTFEITVDGGAALTVAVVATTTAQRAVLGAMDPDVNLSSLFTTAKIPQKGPDGYDAGKTTQKFSTASPGLWPLNTLRLFGTPALIFQSSLLIRMQTSENNSTTTNQERQSGVQYVVMA